VKRVLQRKVRHLVAVLHAEHPQTPQAPDRKVHLVLELARQPVVGDFAAAVEVQQPELREVAEDGLQGVVGEVRRPAQIEMRQLLVEFRAKPHEHGLGDVGQQREIQLAQVLLRSAHQQRVVDALIGDEVARGDVEGHEVLALGQRHQRVVGDVRALFECQPLQVLEVRADLHEDGLLDRG
jgi:hypothetical protein